MHLRDRRILIIGGGFSGMSAAIALGQRGARVTVAEADPGWRNYGAGISLGGATLRAFGQLGVLDDFLREGAASDGVTTCLPDGTVLAQIPTPRLAGPEVPGGGAILRPVLHGILARATRASGAEVRLGQSFSAIVPDGRGCDVTFTTGQRERFDLVIGADGLYSATRQALFPDAPRPQYKGQAVWRAVLPRQPEINGPTMWMGRVKPGVNPVSATQMYLFVTEHRPTQDRVDPAGFVEHLRRLLVDFPAPMLQRIHGLIGPDAQIVFRPLEGLLMQRPWFNGPVVLIGDAVHATTPHLASGACIGIEDALVLADELDRHADTATALQAFQDRRWERVRMVVENSFRLLELEVSGGSKDEQAQIMGRSLAALAQPI